MNMTTTDDIIESLKDANRRVDEAHERVVATLKKQLTLCNTALLASAERFRYLGDDSMTNNLINLAAFNSKIIQGDL